MLYKVNVPLFKSLSHNSVVCISKCIDNNVPSLFPSISAVIKEDTHKLRDSKSRVSIIDVNSNLFVKIIECAVNRHVSIYDITDSSCTHKVLLTKSE